MVLVSVVLQSHKIREVKPIAIVVYLLLIIDF
jgi:hypothetical protein